MSNMYFHQDTGAVDSYEGWLDSIEDDELEYAHRDGKYLDCHTKQDLLNAYIDEGILTDIDYATNRYICQSAEGDCYETFNTVEECLEQLKSYEKDDLLDEGDEVYDVCLEQALYRVVDGKIEEVNNERQ